MIKETVRKKYRPLSYSHRMMGLFFLLLAPTLVYAQPELRLEMHAAIERTTIVNNETVISYETTDETSPGDKLAYTIAYHNVGDEPASNASLTGAIPTQATFLKTLALPAETLVKFSVDGGESYHEPPVMVDVTTAAGKIEKREAKPESYTHIRFTLKTLIQPEVTGSVGYLVQIK